MRNETYELCRKDKKDVNMTVSEPRARWWAPTRSRDLSPALDRTMPTLTRLAAHYCAAGAAAGHLPRGAAHGGRRAPPHRPGGRQCLGWAGGSHGAALCRCFLHTLWSPPHQSTSPCPAGLVCCSGGSGRWPPRHGWQAAMLPLSLSATQWQSLPARQRRQRRRIPPAARPRREWRPEAMLRRTNNNHFVSLGVDGVRLSVIYTLHFEVILLHTCVALFPISILSEAGWACAVLAGMACNGASAAKMW